MSRIHLRGRNSHWVNDRANGTFFQALRGRRFLSPEVCAGVQTSCARREKAELAREAPILRYLFLFQ